MAHCPCGTGRSWTDCCEPIIEGAPAPGPEALMRSRYSAYARGALGHLKASLHPKSLADYDELGAQRWAEGSEWIGLEVVNSREEGDRGEVEFIATFRRRGIRNQHHERARFVREDGHWYYMDGDLVTAGTVRREGARIGRNEPCPCGSGKKYKRCCA